MNKVFTTTAFSVAAGLALVAGSAAAGTVTSKGEDIIIDTTGGLKMETASGKFTFNLGGRLMWDYDYYDGAFTGGGTPVNDRGDAVHHDNLRRARLELEGTVYDNWEYIFTVNFGQSGGTSINDIGLAYTGFDGHKIFLGRGKEPFGLEELTSSKWTSTIERSMFNDATNSDAQTDYGVRYDGWYSMFNWQFGFFSPSEGDGGFPDSNGSTTFAKTGRFTFAPVAQDGNVVHFGVSYSDRASAEAGAERLINASPGISSISKNGSHSNLLRVGSAGQVVADDESQWGLEALGIFGPASLQFEYFMRDVEIDPVAASNAGLAGLSDQEVQSWYLMGTYTLTGESRGYKAKGATPDKISPKGRYGAIELVLKYDYIEADTGGNESTGLNLTPAGSTNPEVTAITAGVNWYVNKNVKLALNYTDASSDNLVAPSTAATPTWDDGDALLFRAQYAF